MINKIDRPDARPHEVLSEVFDLFLDLGADDELADFPHIFTSAEKGTQRRTRPFARTPSTRSWTWCSPTCPARRSRPMPPFKCW